MTLLRSYICSLISLSTLQICPRSLSIHGGSTPSKRIRKPFCWLRNQPVLQGTTPRKSAVKKYLGQGHCQALVPHAFSEDDVAEQSGGPGEEFSESDYGIEETNWQSDGGGVVNRGGSQKSFCVTRVFLDRKDCFKASRLKAEGQERPWLGQRWFPYLDCFKTESTTLTSAEILEMLDPFIFEERKQRIQRVVANRTYSICPIVEGLSDLGNISAVFRSADALGFQSVHVISNETSKRYKKNRKVSMGSEKWLDVELWDSTCDCLETLQKRGYRIAVTHISDDTVPILDIDWSVPTAVLFGNEHRGVSDDALKMSDLRCSIPMDGMVDSFNVSVAAGILMYHVAHDRMARSGKHGDLSPDEQQILAADFYLRHSSHMSSVLDHLGKKRAGKQYSLNI